MTRPNDLHEDAARLLCLALERQRTRRDPAYDELLRRFRSDGTFHATVLGIARGLRLRVLGATDRELVLAADEDSPFALRLADYRQNLSVDERLCHGLIQVAIAAWCYPRAADLEDDDRDLVTVTTRGIVEYLLKLAEALKERATRDPDLAPPELREAWEILLARAVTRETPDGRRAAGTLSGMVAYALERLADYGMLRKESDADGGTWRARATYRVHVRELAAHEAFRLVADARRGIA